jgi:hypothetical protein
MESSASQRDGLTAQHSIAETHSYQFELDCVCAGISTHQLGYGIRV